MATVELGDEHEPAMVRSIQVASQLGDPGLQFAGGEAGVDGGILAFHRAHDVSRGLSSGARGIVTELGDLATAVQVTLERMSAVRVPDLVTNCASRGILRRARPLLALVLICSTQAPAESRDWAATLYGARISSAVGWEDMLLNPVGAKYVDAFLVAAALSRQYASYRDGALALEAEGQVAYNFGDQDHWEINLVPVVVRWRQFPWSHRMNSSAAFGLGLSYAMEMPEVEVEIEGESHQLLIYWVAELTAGPLQSPWAVTLRLHHRSVAWGLMGDEGGMNALGLGVRYGFGARK